MEKNKSVAVVIPIYKSDFSKLEEISLQQALKILYRYDIYFALPENLEIYREFVKKERFPDCFFESTRTYNLLMLNPLFYQRFIAYEYILIYQLDAFVFFDQLEQFCSLEYDYIGAPWLHGIFYYLNMEKKIWHVGNGGLSLRKVKSILELLNEENELLSTFKSNEDLFFSVSHSTSFRTAPVDVALRFSFETEVSRCFQLTGGKLPFGCHAWEKYSYNLWKPYIEKYGYQLPDESSVSKRNDYDREVLAQKKVMEFWKNQYSFKILKKLLQFLYRSEDLKIAVWGAGFYGRQIAHMLNDAMIDVCCFIDNDDRLTGEMFCGKEIMKFEQCQKKYHDVKIIVALTKHHREVGLQLEKNGYCNKIDYLFYKDLMDALIGV